MRSTLAALALALTAGCAAPADGGFDTGGPEPPPPARPGQTVIVDPRVGAFQLHALGDEATLPVVELGSGQRLRLEFDLVGEETGRPLDVSFTHTDRNGQERLLPSETLTGFERDDIRDYERSSAAAQIPYVHYTYDFPNETIGFRISGNFRLTVRDPSGNVILTAPFYVTEELADVSLAFGATVQGGTVGFAVQPAARLRPDPELGPYDGSQYSVCFARNGRTDALRCAPEPSLLDLALFQFYLPRDQAFETPEALYAFDLGLLAVSADVTDVDPGVSPPRALLDLDYAEFGGEVRDPVLAAVPLIEAVYRDVGRADVDGEYVDVTFRYVPEGSRQSPRRVFVRGSFNGWRASDGFELAWQEDLGRYEGTFLIKQGRYVYSYQGARAPTASPSAGSVYTAFVYLEDPRRFTDRLVAVRSAVAR